MRWCGRGCQKEPDSALLMPAAGEGTGRRSGRIARWRSASLLGMQRTGTLASYSVQHHFLSGAGAECPVAWPAGAGNVVRDREDKW